MIDWMFPYQNYTKTLIRQLGLQEAVHYTGPLNEQAMCEQYLHSSLYVLCSSMENSPNSLGEAMLLGMPCVASAMGRRFQPAHPRAGGAALPVRG